MYSSSTQEKPLVRSIEKLDLARFPEPQVQGARGSIFRFLWYLVNALFFQSTILALIPSSAKAKILKFFGADIGSGFVCKPRVNIKSPWFLTVGENVWIGEGVWIDNLCSVKIGSNVCLSQGVKIFTGSHDWSVSTFDYFARPVAVGEGVWVTAFRVIRPGVTIPPHVAVIGDLSPSAMFQETGH